MSVVNCSWSLSNGSTYVQTSTYTGGSSTAKCAGRITITSVTYDTSTKKITINGSLQNVQVGSQRWNSSGIAWSVNGTQYNFNHGADYSYWRYASNTNWSDTISCSQSFSAASTYTIGCKAMYNGGYSAARWDSSSYIVTGSATLTVTIPAYYLDLNGWLDGASSGSLGSYGTTDVYINGGSVATGVADYYTSHRVGSTYEFKNVTAKTGYQYNGVHSGAISGTLSADTSVYLDFSTKQYTVSYAANGGTSTPQSQTKTHFQTLTLRAGITKNNTTANGYTVSFNGNGGTYSGSSKTATDTTSYSFAGWKSGMSPYTVYSGGGAYNEEGNNTLTAQWNSSLSRGSITLPAASTATRQYYTFSGWNTNSAGTGTNYNGGATYTPSANTTLYAKWTPNAPINLSLTRNSSTSNSITLTYADEGVVTSRVAYYRKSGTSNYSSMNITTNPFTITGLDIDTNYDIYFKASNDAASSTTTAQQFSTLLINPTISNINYSDLTPFTVNITCSASINPSRTLSYQFSKDGGTTWTSTQSSNTYQWTGLSEETTYSMAVKVRASHTGVNASDTYAQSNITITTPADQARVRIKVGGNWIVGKGYYKKNGEWIKIKKIYRKVNGEWKIGKNLE